MGKKSSAVMPRYGQAPLRTAAGSSAALAAKSSTWPKQNSEDEREIIGSAVALCCTASMAEIAVRTEDRFAVRLASKRCQWRETARPSLCERRPPTLLGLQHLKGETLGEICSGEPNPENLATTGN